MNKKKNLKPAVLKNFVFDSALYLHLCEVDRFMVGLELSIKRALNDVIFRCKTVQSSTTPVCVLMDSRAYANNGRFRYSKRESKTAFTRCRQILKTVNNVTDRPPVHTKTAHFLPADFENGRF